MKRKKSDIDKQEKKEVTEKNIWHLKPGDSVTINGIRLFKRAKEV